MEWDNIELYMDAKFGILFFFTVSMHQIMTNLEFMRKMTYHVSPFVLLTSIRFTVMISSLLWLLCVSIMC